MLDITTCRAICRVFMTFINDKIKSLIKVFFTCFVFFFASFCLAGCGCLKPYHMPIQQGNILEEQTVQKLKVGMAKDAVADLIGAPVLGNAFADNYWTYVYTNQINGGKIEKKELVLWFADGDIN